MLLELVSHESHYTYWFVIQSITWKMFSFEKAVFPFSRGKSRISQGVENRGSLISVCETL